VADTGDLDGMSRHLDCIAIAALRLINNAAVVPARARRF
jgi:hypothetical protein